MQRAIEMTAQMAKEGFGNCSFTGACSVECPAEISIATIAEMHASFYGAKIKRAFEG